MPNPAVLRQARASAFLVSPKAKMNRPKARLGAHHLPTDCSSRTILAILKRMIAEDSGDDSWRSHLIETDEGVRILLEETQRIAVLGIKTEDSGQPAYEVPEYAHLAGFEIVPVPIYYPDVREILGQPVYRTIREIPGDIDMVNVFRRPRDIPAHLDDIIAKQPKSVWFQLGIRHDIAAERLARAGIDVVQDRCLMVELRQI